uniref:Uncharacterized protein n=1 Tax=Oryza meridionalis TaxID=40149 RepID=A0A0E0EU89_9ORYZ
MGDATAVMAVTGDAAARADGGERSGARAPPPAATHKAHEAKERWRRYGGGRHGIGLVGGERVWPSGRVKRALAAASKSGVETVRWAAAAAGVWMGTAVGGGRGGERIEGGEGHRDRKGSATLEKADEAVARKTGGTERGGAVADDDDGDMFKEEEDARSSSLAAASFDLLLESGHHYHHQLAAHLSMANPRIAAALAAAPTVVSSPLLSPRAAPPPPPPPSILLLVIVGSWRRHDTRGGGRLAVARRPPRPPPLSVVHHRRR